MNALSTNHLKLITPFMLGIFWAGVFLLLNMNSANAQSCSFPTDAGTAMELSAAITCYNAASAGSYAINITQDILLDAAIPAIDNELATLQIDGSDSILDAANSYRPFEVTSGNVTIHNLTIVRGSAPLDCFNLIETCGGGIKVSAAAAVTVTQSAVLSSTAEFGGGISNEGILLVDDTLLRGNTATDSGGGIYAAGNALTTISGSQLLTNTAKDGGGLYNESINFVQVGASEIAHNIATRHGGGIYGDAETEAQVVDTTLTDNSADVGAAIYVGGVMTITNNLIVTNTAQ